MPALDHVLQRVDAEVGAELPTERRAPVAVAATEQRLHVVPELVSHRGLDVPAGRRRVASARTAVSFM